MVGAAGTQVDEARARQESGASCPSLDRSGFTPKSKPTPRTYQLHTGQASLLGAILSPSSSLASGISGRMRGTHKLKVRRRPPGPSAAFPRRQQGKLHLLFSSSLLEGR